MTDAPDSPMHVDVSALLGAAAGGGRVLWSTSNQLQTNVVSLGPDEHVAPHVEPELDVTLVVLSGSVTVAAGDADSTASALSVVVLPAGLRRSLTAGPDGAAYLTAHRARGGFMPRSRPAQG